MTIVIIVSLINMMCMFYWENAVLSVKPTATDNQRPSNNYFFSPNASFVKARMISGIIIINIK